MRQLWGYLELAGQDEQQVARLCQNSIPTFLVWYIERTATARSRKLGGQQPGL